MTDTTIAAGMTAREDLGGREIALAGETQSAALAAAETAAVQARYLVAMKRPRDMDDVRQKLLKECSRPAFASVAIYHKPVGKGITGPSIRLAEAALRALGNAQPKVTTTFDDTTRRILRVEVTDLENNLTFSKDVTIDKTVERSSVKPGQTVLSQRINSIGRATYTVQATDDDLLNKENALVSKALRTLALRILPGDLLDEAMAKVRETLEAGARKDPDGARKAIADAFAEVGVTVAALRELLGHDLGTCSPAEVADLRSIYSAIRDGEATWADTLESRRRAKDEPREEAPPSATAPAAKGKSVAEMKAEAAAKSKAEKDGAS